MVDVAVAAVNYPDTLTIRNMYQFKPPLPFSPGGEFAGTVSALGVLIREVVDAGYGWAADGGAIRPHIGARHPLAQAIADLLERCATGKIAVEIDAT